MIRNLFLLATALVTTACPFEIIGPQASLEGLPAGLEVTLTVAPDQVAQHAPFSAELRVTNTTADTLRVVTAHGCLAIPNVLRDGERVPFEGSWWGCTAAITTHVFPPGETRSHTWQMRAELYAEHAGDVERAPAPRGTYWVQAEFDVYFPGMTAKPAVAAMLRVR